MTLTGPETPTQEVGGILAGAHVDPWTNLVSKIPCNYKLWIQMKSQLWMGEWQLSSISYTNVVRLLKKAAITVTLAPEPAWLRLTEPRCKANLQTEEERR